MQSLGLTVSQSSDAKTLTLTDTSIGDNTAFARSIEVYDGANGVGTLLATIPLTGATADYGISEDKFRSFKLIYVGTPSIAPIFINQTSIGFSQNLLFRKLGDNCGCENPSNSTMLGFIYQFSAQVAARAGNSALANSFITASNKWLKS